MEHRITDILRYVSEHYAENLRLTDIANQFHLASSTLSRYFREETGQSFSEYLAEIRAGNALHELVKTNLPVAEIAKRNGYSSASLFSQIFRRKHHMSPTAYRTQFGALPTSSKQALRLHIDATRPQGPRRMKLAYNLGNLETVSMSSFQNQFRRFATMLRTHRVRVTNMYSAELVSRDQLDQLVLHFDKIDSIFDTIVEAGLVPTIELSNRIGWIWKDRYESLVSTSPTFRTDDEARRIERELLSHFVKRYGLRTIADWRFEFICDYQGYSDSAERHVNIFQQVLLTAKQISSELRIGGSAANLGSQTSLYLNILQEYRRRSLPVDFITAHWYFDIQHSGDSSFSKVLEAADSALHFTGYDNVPLCISEWNLSISERNAFNDTAEKGAAILTTLANSMSQDIEVTYSSFSDLSSSYADTLSMFFGGNGLLSKDGFPKPAFHAFMFLANFPHTIIKSSHNYILGSDDHGSYYLIAYNATGMNSDYSKTKEYEITQSNIKYYYDQGHQLTLHFTITGLEQSRYLLRRYTVSDNDGNAPITIQPIATDNHVERDDYEYAQYLAMPKLHAEKLTRAGDSISFDITLDPHAFCLCRITPC